MLSRVPNDQDLPSSSPRRGSLPHCHVAHVGQTPPFAELVRLSPTSIADEMREEHRRRVLGEIAIDQGGGKRRGVIYSATPLGSDYGAAQINAPMLAIGFVKPVPARPCRRWDIVIATVKFDPFLQIGQR
jgi:hypothetical protein